MWYSCRPPLSGGSVWQFSIHTMQALLLLLPLISSWLVLTSCQTQRLTALTGAGEGESSDVSEVLNIPAPFVCSGLSTQVHKPCGKPATTLIYILQLVLTFSFSKQVLAPFVCLGLSTLQVLVVSCLESDTCLCHDCQAHNNSIEELTSAKPWDSLTAESLNSYNNQ